MKEQMTKKEIIELYISDLKNIVFDSPARDNRIKTLEDELDHLTAEQGDDNLDTMVERFSSLIKENPEAVKKIADKIKKQGAVGPTVEEYFDSFHSSPELTVREVVEWCKEKKRWLKIHSNGYLEISYEYGFKSLSELTKIIRG